MSRVVVIGAGISGLATAGLLARQGHEVTVVEKRDALGGRAGSWEQDGFRFDTGPSWYLMPEVFDHFYRLMGTTADEQLHLVTLDPGYRVYFEGSSEPLDIAASREENVALFESIERGAGRRLERHLDSAAQTYDLAKRQFLYTTFADLRRVFTAEVIAKGARFLRLLTRPLWSMVAGSFDDDRLRQVLAYPAVFLGSSPFTTPSMYHLMSHLDLEAGVLYPMGGFARVIESIADLAVAAGATIVTDAAATRIVVERGRVTGVDTVAGFFPADVVVAAADLHHVETTMLEPAQQTYGQEYWHSRVAGPSALLLYLGVEGRLPELEHHTLLFARDWEAGFGAIFDRGVVPDPASVYVCKPSGVDPDVAPEGSENVFVLVPIPADPAIGSRGDAGLEALADRTIGQIAEWAGIPDLASRITTRRIVGPGDFASELNAWRGTALGPAHTLRQSAFFRAGDISKKVEGLVYAGGSTIPGIGLPMCLISAELVVKRLARDTSAGPLETLPPLARRP